METNKPIFLNHWNTARTARYLGVNERTLEAWRCYGGGPPFRKIGRKVVYEPTTVERWAEGKTRENTIEPRRRKP